MKKIGILFGVVMILAILFSCGCEHKARWINKGKIFCSHDDQIITNRHLTTFTIIYKDDKKRVRTRSFNNRYSNMAPQIFIDVDNKNDVWIKYEYIVFGGYDYNNIYEAKEVHLHSIKELKIIE